MGTAPCVPILQAVPCEQFPMIEFGLKNASSLDQIKAKGSRKSSQIFKKFGNTQKNRLELLSETSEKSKRGGRRESLSVSAREKKTSAKSIRNSVSSFLSPGSLDRS